MSRLDAYRLANGDIALYEPAARTLAFCNREMAYQCVAAIDATPEELDSVLDATTPVGATRAIRALTDAHTERITDIVFTNLADVLAGLRRSHGYTRLFRSPADRAPLPMPVMGKRMAALEAELCSRDDECRGAHRWVIGHADRYDILIWHLNTATAAVVPPRPLVVRP